MNIAKTLFIILFTYNLYGQSAMDKLLKTHNTRAIPYISVSQLHEQQQQYLILDTRKREEYLVSHLPNAVWVSEKVTDSTYNFSKTDKDQQIAVYCTVGIRSEDYGAQLKKMGFTRVKNLYGSIFAWKDANFELHNAVGKKTDSVHTFSKTWAKYLNTGIKVY